MATGQDLRQQVLSEPFPVDLTSGKRMDGLDRLAELAAQQKRLTGQIAGQVDGLAAAGTSWPAIAQALGVSRQAAHQTHTRRQRSGPDRLRHAAATKPSTAGRLTP